VSSWVDWSSLGKVLAAGLLGGVGLVVFFSLGLMGLSAAEGPDGRTKAVAMTAAVVCFALVALGVCAGLYVVLED
jgi:hypothetical protein